MNLSPEYDIELEAMLARLGATPGIGPSLLTGFWPMTGSAYSDGLMVVGRAVNGWIDNIAAPELANATARAQLRASMRRTAEGDGQCPMRWVTDAWGRRGGYSTARSAFWRKLRVRGSEVYVGGSCRTPQTVEEAKREALAVAVALGDDLERRRLQVRAILCVHRADLPFFGSSAQGVSIVDGRGLVKTLRKAPRRLEPADVLALASLANDRFRPASAPVPTLYKYSVPPHGETPVIPPPASPLAAELQERFQPPVRRAQLQLAREARARATDKRVYWTRGGLAEGKAPPTLPPAEADKSL